MLCYCSSCALHLTALPPSLSFTSDTEGYHDIAILSEAECPNADCCAFGEMTESDYTSLYGTNDFKNKATYVWTPTQAGTYHVVCTLSQGGHCQFGQNFKVTVEEADAPSAASMVPASLLGLFAVAASLVCLQ